MRKALHAAHPRPPSWPSIRRTTWSHSRSRSTP